MNNIKMRSFDWIDVPERIGVNKTKAILNIKGSDYCCIITEVSKSNVTKLLQNIDLTKKMKHYKTKYQEQFRSCKFISNSNLNEKK